MVLVVYIAVNGSPAQCFWDYYEGGAPDDNYLSVEYLLISYPSIVKELPLNIVINFHASTFF